MEEWRPTAALARALVCGVGGLVLAVLLGEPGLVVLAAPFLLHAALAAAHRPGSPAPRPGVVSDHTLLHEGQATTSRLRLDLDGAEQVTWVRRTADLVATQPSSGVVTGTVSRPPVLLTRPLRWGRHEVGEERIAVLSRWAGFRLGPVQAPDSWLRVLPATAPYDSRATAPRPAGLVGGHRSRRPGAGTEFEGVRPFAAGDRLRRIDWRVSLRTGDLHVVATDSEEDAAILLVVDAHADLGVSGGLAGAASSLDLSVRAASSLAEHHVRRGDRVGLRVLGPTGLDVPPGFGTRHLERVRGTLTRLRPQPSAGGEGGQEQTGAARPWGVGGDEIVYLLSPLMEPGVAATAAQLSARGHAVLVVDVLSPGTPLVTGEGPPADVVAIASRMRLLERDQVVRALSAAGCPVVPWRGPGTLDEVLRRLARRDRMPRVRRT